VLGERPAGQRVQHLERRVGPELDATPGALGRPFERGERCILGQREGDPRRRALPAAELRGGAQGDDLAGDDDRHTVGER